MSKFLDHLQERLMVGDGAIGTLLYQRGEPMETPYDVLNIDKPEVVLQLHEDYLDAGAQLIETNTFGANRHKLQKHRRDGEVIAINKAGAELAVRVARTHGAFVAGSIGPLTSNPSENLEASFKTVLYQEQIEGLLTGGVDLLFLETFPSLGELLIALCTARAMTPVPVIASLSFSDDGHTADGFRINEAFTRLREAGADVTGLNCHLGPSGTERLLQELEVGEKDLVSVYPNAGRPVYHEGRYIYHPTAQYFADYAPRFVAQGARLIGGCCGTTPETIRAIARSIERLSPVGQKRGIPLPISPTPRVTAPPPRKDPEETLLDVLKKRTLIVTELDPPKGLQLAKMVEGAAALREAGTDFVTLADNSLAILRVSNMAAGFLIKERTGLEPVIHLSCRDRNLIGLQSELMGFHALGIRHILALTGDPAKLGDHPAASSVYDVNSVGLIKTVARLNEGFAANGRDLKSRTQFIIGCAFNPNARNIDSQVRKLEDKVKAGAHFVMTQPIFDPHLALVTREKTRHLGIPILVGVMPLLNGRNTEFLHNEVPGIVVPDSLRERMRGKEGETGNAEGLKIARELVDAILEHFNGIYLITPLMRFDLTVELSRYARKRRASV